MRSSNERGRAFELKVAGMIRRKVDPGAKRNAGSHANWHRRSDIFTNLPFHVEAKDHETLKPKEWFRQAEEAASFSQIPIVAFQMDDQVMAMLRFDDVLNLLVEIADLKLENEDLRGPISVALGEQPMPKDVTEMESDYDGNIVATIEDEATKRLSKMAVEKKIVACKAGHIADEYGYCQQLDCKFSRGYKPKKKERRK